MGLIKLQAHLGVNYLILRLRIVSVEFREILSPFDLVWCLNGLTGELRAKSGAVREFHKITNLGSVEGAHYSRQLSCSARVHPGSRKPSFHGFRQNLVIVVIPTFSLGMSENSDSGFVQKIF